MRFAYTAALSACALLFAGTANAVTIPSAPITGVFSDPVYAGVVINNPTAGVNTYYDNSATAGQWVYFNSVNQGSNNQLQWGTYPDTNIVPAQYNFSQITFDGAVVPAAPQTTPIKIGTITFLNGTSEIDSIIFGATLTFYQNGTQLGSDHVYINTTTNQYTGTGLSPAQLQTDADYVNICGNSSNICGSSIEAYEDSEGGSGVVVDLYATYDPDPSLTLTSATLDPNQPGGVNGYVGTLPAVVPEPSTWAMLILGMGALGGVLRRRRGAAFVAA